MDLPPHVDGFTLLDLSSGAPIPEYEYAIGRYNEKRPGIYTTELFTERAGDARDIHVGIDLFAPIGTPLKAFADGTVIMRGYNAAPGDYGYTLITEHVWDSGHPIESAHPDLAHPTEIGQPLYVLWGHLSARSVTDNPLGRKFKAGDVIAWLGDRTENGDWPPHVHFQLSRKRPEKCDLPGVVAAADLKDALEAYPDPRLILGPIY